MATITVEKSENWKEFPLELQSSWCDIQNVGAANFELWPAHLKPADDFGGFVFTPLFLKSFDLSDGKKMYIKTNDNLIAIARVLV